MAKAVTSKPSALSLRRAVKPLMIPASSSARTRRKQGGAETPCLGSLRAILRPPAKRIEKKLGVVRSGNFGRPGARRPGPQAQSPAPEDAAALIAHSRKAAAKTWIITDGSVGME